MLESGTNPSIQTQFDWAPLHWTAYFGHIDCVKLLIEAGANLNPVSDQDASPLDLALRANQVNIVNTLSRAGALESRDIQGLAKPTEVWNTAAPSSPRKERSTSNSLSKTSLTFDKPI